MSPAENAARLDAVTDAAFARDVLEGLSAAQKWLPPKWFYDETGSRLFEDITRLEEYYPTRTELGILRAQAGALAALVPPDSALVEFGAGASLKVRALLEGGARFSAYVPIDISGDFLRGEAQGLQRDFPALAVHPVVADFTRPVTLPRGVIGRPRVGFFPGSTIGNFDPPDAAALLRGFGEVLGTGAHLVVGADLEKDRAVLERAYDDAAGVTAAFNLNLLDRINLELNGDFRRKAFTHRAVYNEAQHRIEMHLVSQHAQTVRVLGRRFSFAAGETIHTESSYKYSLASFAMLAERSGWRRAVAWTDADNLFSVHVLTRD